MAHVQYMDELIKEYLQYRGFNTTLKAFEIDLRNDKERAFRVDKIIEQLVHHINTYDLNGLKELWSHLDVHMFSKLESPFISAVKKLENGILKMYLVNAVANNKSEKVNEFFIKMTNDLQNQIEWKDWFMLPYIKNPEENPLFALNFTKQWQDTLWVSLHNFLASIFQYMPMPRLLKYEEDSLKIHKLEEKNESLKSRLALLIEKGPEKSVVPYQVEPPIHLLDDFCTIAQQSNNAESQAKSLKNIIKNMSTGSSPILGRKENTHTGKKKSSSSAKV